jgi:hypothetical protein
MTQDQWIDLGLYASYVLIGIAIVAAVGMNFANALNDPKSLIKGLAGIVVLAAVFFIGYSMAPSEFGQSTAMAFESAKIDPAGESTGNTYKLVGGAMTTTLVLILIAVVGLIYSSVSRIAR